MFKLTETYSYLTKIVKAIFKFAFTISFFAFAFDLTRQATINIHPH